MRGATAPWLSQEIPEYSYPAEDHSGNIRCCSDRWSLSLSHPPATSRSAAGFARFSRDSPQREISPVSAFSHLRRSALALAISSLRKQKSRLFCNFFAIADPSLFLQSLNELFPLHFRASIGDWGLCDNPQSQKSCSSDRFSVFDFQDSSRAVLVRLDPARH